MENRTLRKLDGTIKNEGEQSLFLPRKGKIRLGVKAKNSSGTEYPKEVDYFVCPEEVTAVLGPKPTEISILFPVNDNRVIFNMAYKWYGAQAIKCKGNGEFALRKVSALTKEQREEQAKAGTLPPNEFDIAEVTCPCPMLGVKGGCDKIATLSFLIPSVSMAGVYQIDMKSEYGIRNILSGLMMARAATMGPKHPNGTVAMVPMKLIRRPQKIEYNGKTATHHLVFLEHQISHDQFMRYRNGGVEELAGPDAHVEPTAAIEHPGVVDTGFTEEPDTEEGTKPTPEEVEGVIVKTEKVDGKYAIKAENSFGGNIVSFWTENRDIAEHAFRAIKPKTIMKMTYIAGEGSDEIVAIEKA